MLSPSTGQPFVLSLSKETVGLLRTGLSKHVGDLRSTERLLWKLISYPEGVAKGLRHYGHPPLPIRGDRRLSAAARLNIYANMYFYRIRDSLKEDFPALLALLGENGFHNLITDYLLAHPPRHWSLRNAGERLPRFLKGHACRKRWPCVVSLARFEWALIEAFDAEDTKPLAAGDLRKIPPPSWAGLRFRLAPSVRLLRSAHPVGAIRACLIKQRRVQTRKGGPETLVIWRRGHEVMSRSLDVDEGDWLRALEWGETFGAVCRRAARSGSEAESARKVASCLQGWIADGLLVPPS